MILSKDPEVAQREVSDQLDQLEAQLHCDRPISVRAALAQACALGISLATVRARFNVLKVLGLTLALMLAACNGAVSGNTPEADPCDAARAECFEACPVNAGPGATAADSCAASCNAEHALCVSPPPPALACERVGEDHGCASSGCWGTYECNRDPSAELGLTCAPASEGVWSCRW